MEWLVSRMVATTALMLLVLLGTASSLDNLFLCYDNMMCGGDVVSTILTVDGEDCCSNPIVMAYQDSDSGVCTVCGPRIAEVQFVSDLFEIEEGEAVDIGLYINPLVDHISTSINVSILAQNGTAPLDALELVDFYPSVVTFTFDGDNLTANSMFYTVDDDVIEGDEFFYITILPGVGYIVGNLSTASVKIIDEEASVLEVDIFSDDAIVVGTESGSDTDLKVYSVEGQTIEICGVIDLDEYYIDSDLDITVPLSIEFPWEKLYSAEEADFITMDSFELFFEHPVVEQQRFCLNEAITIAIDERLEGFEEFYVTVNSSLSTPPGVRYGENFLVIIKDDVSNISLGFTMTEVYVNEGEDVHIDVCVALNGNIDELETSFFVEFDLCALGKDDDTELVEFPESLNGSFGYFDDFSSLGYHKYLPGLYGIDIFPPGGFEGFSFPPSCNLSGSSIYKLPKFPPGGFGKFPHYDHYDYSEEFEGISPDISFVTLPEGCPYSMFNDPPFPPGIDKIKILVPGYDSNYGNSIPEPGFANFVPGTNLSACVTLTVIDDDNFENSEMFKLSVYAIGPDFYLPFTDGLNYSIITIHDPEDVTVTILNDTITVSEGEAFPVCIQVQTRGNIFSSFNVAVMGNDEVSLEVNNVTFPSLSVPGSISCVGILILDDDILEGEEVVEITIASDDVSIDRDTLQIIIQDDNDLDAVSVDFSASGGISGEEGSQVSVCLTANSMLLSFETSLMVTTVLMDSDLAVFGTDYVPDSLVFTFSAPGEQCGNISLLSDDALEGDHSFVISINSTNLDIPVTGSRSITIEDTNTVTVFTVESSIDVVEGDTASFCVEIADIAPFGGLEVPVVVTVEGQLVEQLTDNQDFTLNMTELTFPSGTTVNGNVQCTTVTITDDQQLEGDNQMFVIVISESSPPGIVLAGYPNNTLITIADDEQDDATVSLEPVFLSLNESSGMREFCVILTDEPMEGRAVPITVFISPISISSDEFKEAIFGVDWNLPNSSVTLEVGMSRECFEVSILEDDIFEETESFHVTISDTSPPININETVISGASVEDNTAGVEIVVTGNLSLVFSEDEFGRFNVCVLVTSLPAGGLSCDQIVVIEMNSGTAVEGADYWSRLIEIPVHSTANINSTFCRELEIDKLIVDDKVVESDESFQLRAISPDGLIGLPDTLVITIQDNDDVKVGFERGEYTVMEASDGIEVCVEHKGDLQREVTVEISEEVFQVESSGVTFITTLTLGTGASPSNTVMDDVACFNFSRIEDDIKEGLEVFVLRLNSMDSAVCPGRDFSLVSILPNGNVTVSISGGDRSVREDAGSVEFCVSLDHPPLVPVSVTITTTDGTAIGGRDFSPVEKNLRFGVGFGTRECIYIPIMNDICLEDTDEKFLVSISSNIECVVINSSANSVEVTITDDDDVQVGFQQQQYIVLEGTNDTEICVEHKQCLERPISVLISQEMTVVADLVLGEGASSSRTVMEDVACFNYSHAEDDVKEELEVITLLLNSSDPNVCLGRDFTLVNIPPNGEVIVSIIGGNQVIDEDVGSVEVCMELDHMPLTPVSITVTTSSGTALGDEDYVSTEKNVTFAVGLGTTQCIHIPILNDVCLEDTSETFSVFISSDVDCVMTDPSANRIDVTITDDDDVLVGFEETEYTLIEASGAVQICVVHKECLQREVTLEICKEVLGLGSESSAFANLTLGKGANFSNTITDDRACFEYIHTEDQIKEGLEVFVLSLRSTDPNVCLGTESTLVRIPPNGEVMASIIGGNQVVEEDVGAVEVCVMLDHPPLTPVSVTISTMSLSAHSDVDYISVEKNLTFAVGLGIVECVHISVLNDVCLENSEVFTVSISSDAECITVDESASSVNVTITDEDAVQVSFQQTKYTVTEASDDVQICVTHKECLQRKVTVQVSLDTVVTGNSQSRDNIANLTLGKGASSFNVVHNDVACFNFSQNDDAIKEGLEVFALLLSSTDPAVCLGRDLTLVTVPPNGNVEVFITSGDQTVGEDAGSVKVCVSLDHTPEVPVSVTLFTSAGTAVGNEDYVSTRKILTFAVNLGILECVHIPVLNDVCLEDANETFSVSISSDLDYVTVNTSASSVEITITDNDYVQAGFQQTEYTVDEASGDIQICVEHKQCLQREVMVQVSLDTVVTGNSQPINNIASLILGEDASSFNTVVNQVACFNFSQRDDAIKEGLEVFALLLSAADPVVCVGRDLALVTVPPNGNVTVSITSDDQTIDEDAGSVKICVSLDHAPLVPVSVTLTTADGTALGDDDFAQTEKQLSFAVNLGLEQCVHIPILNDECLESTSETFSVSISSNSDCVTVNSSASSVDITIIDEDDIQVGFQQMSYVINEGSDNIQICAVHKECLQREIEFSVHQQIESRSIALTDLTLGMGASSFNSVKNDEACFNFSRSDDDIKEGLEMVVLTLNSTDPAVCFGRDVSLVSVPANGNVTVHITGGNQIVDENAGAVEVCVSLDHIPLVPVFVTLSTVDGTALGGQDYVSTDKRLTFAVGLGIIECVNIPILNDLCLESNETFLLSISSNVDCVTVDPSASSIEVTITDEDDIQVGFQKQQYTVIEGTGVVEICIEHKECLERPLSLQVSQEATGEVIADLVLGEGASSSRTIMNDVACFNYSQAEDDVKEELEAITLLLDSSDPNVCLGRDFTLVNIPPNGEVVVSIVGANREVTEEDGSVEVCVSLNHMPLTPVLVTLVTADGTALSGEDYVSTETNLTFAVGLGIIECARIPVLNDMCVEQTTETFTVSISSDVECVMIDPSANTIEITISENDDVQVGFQQTEYTVEEGSAGIQICVEHKECLQREITLEVYQEVLDQDNPVGNAIANLTLGEGASSFNTITNDVACFNYTQIEDNVKEGLEVLVLTLKSTDDDVCFGTESTLVRVPPNGNVTARIANVDQTIDEDIGSVKVCVSLDHTPQVPVSVTVTTVDGTALGGEDYVSVEKMLTFAVGLGTVECFHISVINDKCLESSTEFFSITITSDMECVTVDPSASSVDITITDDDDVQVSFERMEYTAVEGSDVEICVVHKECLQREIALEVNKEVLGRESSERTAIAQLTLGAGASSLNSVVGDLACFNFSQSKDDIKEGLEVFILTLISVDPGVCPCRDFSLVNIPSNGDVTVSISSGNQTVGEDAGSVKVCVSLDHIPQVPVSVTITSADETALGGEDYESIEKSVTLVGTVECIHIPILNDDCLEDAAEAFSVSITSDLECVIIDPSASRVSITIMDNNDIQVGFQQQQYTVVEGTGVVEICIEHKDCLQRPISMLVSQEVLGIDSSDNAPVTELILGDGATSFNAIVGDIACFNYSQTEDDIKEELEVITLLLDSSDPNVCLGRDFTLVNIPPNGEVTVSIIGSSRRAREDDGSIEVCVKLDHPSLTPVFVTLTTTSGTAMGGEDYISVEKNLTFAVGLGIMECTHIAILNDECVEEMNETFSISITSDVECVIVNPSASSIQVTITDNDDVQVGFQMAEYSVPEAANSIQICVEHKECLQREIELEVTVKETGDAEVSMIASLTLGEGASFSNTVTNDVACFSYSQSEDGIKEGLEVLVFMLSSIDPAVCLGRDSALLHIPPNGEVTVGISTGNVIVEESVGSVEVCVELDHIPLVPVSVTIFTVPGTAQGDKDYISTEKNLTFAVGLGTVECVHIAILNDMCLEDTTEMFSVSISSDMECVHIDLPRSSVEIMVTDDDDIQVSFQQMEYTVAEASSSIQICVDHKGCLEREVVLGVNKEHLGIEPSEQTTIADLTLGIGASSFNTIVDDVACFNFSQSEDNVKEGLEVFVLTLDSTDPGVCPCRDFSLVNIPPNGAVRVNITTGSLIVGENIGSVEVCVALDHPSLVPVSVLVFTDPQTATSDEDYVRIEKILTFAVGLSTMECVHVPVLNDDCLEDLETFTVSISSDVECVTVEPSASSVEITIADDDNILVGFTKRYLEVTEDSNVVEVCVEVCEGVLKRDVVIDVEEQNITATSPADFSIDGPLGHTFTAVNFETPYCFDVNIVDDVACEDTETFGLSLLTDDSSVLMKVPSLTIEIHDNDYVEVGFSQPTYSVSEADGTVQVCVQLEAEVPIEKLATVDVTVLPGSATAADFTVDNNIHLTFSQIGMECFDISITADQLLEKVEQLSLVLIPSDPSIHVIQQSAVVVITDSERLIIGFSEPVYTIEEDDEEGIAGNSMSIQVIMVSSVEIQREFTFYISAVGLTATGGQDYDDILFTAESRTIHFSAPRSRRATEGVEYEESFNIFTLPDSVVEENETFILQLSSNDANIEFLPQNATVVIIDNDVISFIGQTPSLTLDEGNSSEVCVAILDGVTERAIEIIATTQDGSAIGEGRDYMSFREILLFDATTSQVCTGVTTTLDGVYELPEVFTVSLTSRDSAVNTISVSESAIKILDLDEVRFSLSAPAGICEGTRGDLCVVLESVIEREASADLTISEIDDETMVQFFFNSTTDAEQCTSLEVDDDDDVELCIIQANVTISSTSERAVIDPSSSSAVVLSYDNEDVTFNFAGDTPSVDGNNMTLFLDFQGCSAVECDAGPLSNVDCSGAINGAQTLVGISNGQARQTLSVSANPFCGQDTVTLERNYRSDSDFCFAHFINNGPTFIGDTLFIEFERTGPDTDNFINTPYICRIDRGRTEPCTDSFTAITSLLEVGEHRVLIRPPNVDECTRRINLRYNFVVLED